MTRRKFLKVMLGLTVLSFAGALNIIKIFIPKSVIYAEKGPRYPGRIKSMRDADISKPALWTG